ELVIAENQVALAFNPVKAGFLVFAVDHWNDLPTFQSQQTDFVDALETHQALIVDDGAVRFEFRTPRLVALKALHYFSNGSDRHLARQSELFPQLVVAPSMNAGLAKPVRLEPDLGGVCRGCVDLPHGRQ